MIYFLLEERTGNVKIGIVGGPLGRAALLQTGNSSILVREDMETIDHWLESGELPCTITGRHGQPYTEVRLVDLMLFLARRARLALEAEAEGDD